MEEHLYYRDDKFRDHIRVAHPSWLEKGGLGDCKVPRMPSVPFPRRYVQSWTDSVRFLILIRCGFCDRNRFYARDWNHLCNHIADHFKAGATMAQWRRWPEDEPEEEDDLEEDGLDAPKPDDDEGDHNSTDNDEDQSRPHDPPPDPGTMPYFDPSSGGDSGGWSPSFGGFLHPWDSNFLSLQCTPTVAVSSLPSVNSSNMLQKSSRCILPVLSKERINLKGGTGSVYRITVPDSSAPRNKLEGETGDVSHRQNIVLGDAANSRVYSLTAFFGLLLTLLRRGYSQ